MIQLYILSNFLVLALEAWLIRAFSSDSLPLSAPKLIVGYIIATCSLLFLSSVFTSFSTHFMPVVPALASAGGIAIVIQREGKITNSRLFLILGSLIEFVCGTLLVVYVDGML